MPFNPNWAAIAQILGGALASPDGNYAQGAAQGAQNYQGMQQQKAENQYREQQMRLAQQRADQEAAQFQTQQQADQDWRNRWSQPQPGTAQTASSVDPFGNLTAQQRATLALAGQNAGVDLLADWTKPQDAFKPNVEEFYQNGQKVKGYLDQNGQLVTVGDSVPLYKPEGAGVQIDTNGDGVPDITFGGSGMKLTEGQSTGTMQFSLADQANNALGQLDTVLTSTPDYIASQFGTAGNFLKSPEYQRAEQSATIVAEQYLRALTGAAAPEPEVKRVTKSILPQPGDGAEVIAQKRATRQTIIDALRVKAGPGAYSMPPAAEPAAQAPANETDAPTATGPGGQKLILRNGQWVPM